MVGSSLQSSLQLCQKIKKKKKNGAWHGRTFCFRLRKQKPPDKTKQKVEPEGNESPGLSSGTWTGAVGFGIGGDGVPALGGSYSPAGNW